MESAIFHLNSNELNMKLQELIERNEKSSFNYQVPADDFKSLVAQFNADENFDIVEAIRAYKTEKRLNQS